ncbi:MAG: DUF523 domain-containing protein [Oscillospiraceae bacterium]|nr:DUF523 domain-containing protein [Oscillospiraceae bacterium]
MKDKLLISACLLGFCCKYDGGTNTLPADTIAALREQYELIPVCPETAGGLPIPRAPSERRGGRVLSREGNDVTDEYEKGALLALALAERFGCRRALLKERSPSCGAGEIYDGTFSHSRVPGDGVAAEALRKAGLTLYGESETEKLIK